MSLILERVLAWAAARLPETHGVWIEDLRQEAKYVAQGVRRFRFLWGGVMAALGAVLYLSVGPKRVGQVLLGASVSMLCLMVFMFTLKINDPTAKLIVCGVLALYTIAAGLVVLNLRLLKGFALGSSFSLAGIWLALGSSSLIPSHAPIDFIRAFTIEAAVFMIGLFIAATYLAWAETSKHS